MRALRALCVSTAITRAAAVRRAPTHMAHTCATSALNLGSLLSPDPSTFAIGGHRGCGENLLDESTLRAGVENSVMPAQRENTVRSFCEAVQLGVSFVEFDVQVTSDGVPVIWHDDLIVTSTSACGKQQREVKDLTLAQFKSLVQHSDVPGVPEWATTVVRHFRSKQTSQGVPGDAPWVCDRDDNLPTLRDVFQAVPENIGFDVEVKMTVPDTVERTSEEEIARVVGPILEVVDECTRGSSRTIIFSSFDPDICIELRQRQSRFPVMYLSGCGLYEHVDVRRTSIPAAIEVAALHGMAGIVVPASILMKNGHMVKDAASRGLMVLTYGLDNDDPMCIQRQKDLGVHAAIVDDVKHVLPLIRGH